MPLSTVEQFSDDLVKAVYECDIGNLQTGLILATVRTN